MTSSFSYTVHGLRLRSTLPLPGLPAASGGPADVTIEFRGAVDCGASILTSAPTYQEGIVAVWHLGRDTWGLRYGNANDDSLTVLVSQAGRHITVAWTSQHIAMEAAPSLFAPILLGSVMGAALHLRGVPCLHASAAVVDGRAALVLGTSGAGKSTLAAALLSQGATVLADDISALDVRPDGIWVEPGLPSLRLWPDSARTFGWLPETLPKVWASAEDASAKCVVDLIEQPSTYCTVPAPLATLYVLEPRRSHNDPSLIAPIPPRNAALYLMQHVYGARWLDHACRIRAFKVCARIAETRPVYRLVPGGSLAELPALARMVSETARSRDGAPGAFPFRGSSEC
jgi:hypothetical protein